MFILNLRPATCFLQVGTGALKDVESSEKQMIVLLLGYIRGVLEKDGTRFTTLWTRDCLKDVTTWARELKTVGHLQVIAQFYLRCTQRPFFFYRYCRPVDMPHKKKQLTTITINLHVWKQKTWTTTPLKRNHLYRSNREAWWEQSNTRVWIRLCSFNLATN